MRSLLLIFASLLFTSICGAQITRPMASYELKHLAAQDQQMRHWESVGGDLMKHTYSIRIYNQSIYELMKVGVELVVYRHGKVVYRSKPVQLTQFPNVGLPYVGSLLRGTTAGPIDVTFTFPNEYWTTEDSMSVETVSASVWTGAGDIHDAGHLFEMMTITKTPQLIKMFDRDPSLLNVRNSKGFCPILMAYTTADPDFVKYLEKKGAKSTYTTPDGYTALHYAIMGGKPETLAYALKYCNIDAPLRISRRTPLHQAIDGGWYECTEWLLKHGANPNAIDAQQFVPLSLAIVQHQAWAIPILVKYKADVHHHDPAGYGLMHYATKSSELLPAVAKLGISVNDTSPRFGITPLMMASMLNHMDSVTWLIVHGANLNTKDHQGKTAQDWSKTSNTLKSDMFFLRALERARAQMKKK